MKPQELFGVFLRTIGLSLVMSSAWFLLLGLITFVGGGPAGMFLSAHLCHPVLPCRDMVPPRGPIHRNPGLRTGRRKRSDVNRHVIVYFASASCW